MSPLSFRRFSKFAAVVLSVLFHPLFISFYTVILYFTVSRYFFYDIGRLIRLLFLATVVVPVLILAVLYKSKLVKSLFMHDLRVRAGFSLFLAVLYGVLYAFMKPLPGMAFLAMFYLGIAVSLTVAALFYALKVKISLHALSIGGALTFFLLWSYVHAVNILDIIAGIAAVGTWILAARLYLKAHTPAELAWGFFAGIAGQLAAYWLTFGF